MYSPSPVRSRLNKAPLIAPNECTAANTSAATGHPLAGAVIPFWYDNIFLAHDDDDDTLDIVIPFWPGTIFIAHGDDDDDDATLDIVIPFWYGNMFLADDDDEQRIDDRS